MYWNALFTCKNKKYTVILNDYQCAYDTTPGYHINDYVNPYKSMKNLRKAKWPSTITRFKDHFAYGLIWWFASKEKVWSYMTPTVLTDLTESLSKKT